MSFTAESEKPMSRSRAADSLAVAGLVLLGIVPAIFGSVRLRQITGGIATADNARFLAMPWPVVVHIVGAVLFALPGAFQFSAELRRRRMEWHRLAGVILVPCGLAVSLSGLWMAQFYPSVALDGVAVYWMRIVVGVMMTVALWLGVSAVRRGDIGAHRAWMMRAYALGMGAGTQVFTHVPLMIAPVAQERAVESHRHGCGVGHQRARRRVLHPAIRAPQSGG